MYLYSSNRYGHFFKYGPSENIMEFSYFQWIIILDTKHNINVYLYRGTTTMLLLYKPTSHIRSLEKKGLIYKSSQTPISMKLFGKEPNNKSLRALACRVKTDNIILIESWNDLENPLNSITA
jgi:hypothetical protein